MVSNRRARQVRTFLHQIAGDDVNLNSALTGYAPVRPNSGSFSESSEHPMYSIIIVFISLFIPFGPIIAILGFIVYSFAKSIRKER